MGCQNSKEFTNNQKPLKEKNQNVNDEIPTTASSNTTKITSNLNNNQNNNNNKSHFTQDELSLIRSSWKDITKNGDYKDYGAALMIKFVLFIISKNNFRIEYNRFLFLSLN